VVGAGALELQAAVEATARTAIVERRMVIMCPRDRENSANSARTVKRHRPRIVLRHAMFSALNTGQEFRRGGGGGI
jgi:hypothetical protein